MDQISTVLDNLGSDFIWKSLDSPWHIPANLQNQILQEAGEVMAQEVQLLGVQLRNLARSRGTPSTNTIPPNTCPEPSPPDESQGQQSPSTANLPQTTAQWGRRSAINRTASQFPSAHRFCPAPGRSFFHNNRISSLNEHWSTWHSRSSPHPNTRYSRGDGATAAEYSTAQQGIIADYTSHNSRDKDIGLPRQIALALTTMLLQVRTSHLETHQPLRPATAVHQQQPPTALQIESMTQFG